MFAFPDGMHTPFDAQHPVQLDAEHGWPASLLEPALHAPLEQFCPLGQATHEPPPTPHAEGVSPGWQSPVLMQQPLQFVGLQAADPFVQDGTSTTKAATRNPTRTRTALGNIEDALSPTAFSRLFAETA
jgi:hypothetical protein